MTEENLTEKQQIRIEFIFQSGILIPELLYRVVPAGNSLVQPADFLRVINLFLTLFHLLQQSLLYFAYFLLKIGVPL